MGSDSGMVGCKQGHRQVVCVIERELQFIDWEEVFLGLLLCGIEGFNYELGMVQGIGFYDVRYRRLTCGKREAK